MKEIVDCDNAKEKGGTKTVDKAPSFNKSDKWIMVLKGKYKIVTIMIVSEN